MIIVNFNGGLGNQMMQYAAYVALRERYPHIRVLADTDRYYYLKMHNGFELDRIFPIHLNILFGNRQNKILANGKYFHFVLNKIVVKFFKIGLNKYRFIKDVGAFNEELFYLDAKKNYYLEGQWGNVKYFENAKDLVRQYFTFKSPLETVNEIEAKKIINKNSVGVHIRRGDYINQTDFVDLSSSEYYPAAFHFLNNSLINPSFFIFSDDIEWCRENLKWLVQFEHSYVKGNSGIESYKDMQLMSLCKHNIIANSTFSWWSGWLNNNPDKLVICPKKLFQNKIVNDKIVEEFYPITWVKM